MKALRLRRVGYLRFRWAQATTWYCHPFFLAEQPLFFTDGTLNLSVPLLLFAFVFALASCNMHRPEGNDALAALPTASNHTPSPVPSPSPSPSPTLTILPTVPAAAPSGADRRTATDPPLASATATHSPSPTVIPTLTPTWTSSPTPTLTSLPSPVPVATSELTQDLMHILLIGGDSDYFLDMNTDTLIVAVINRETRQVSLLSIPRDLWVYIPTYGWGRINMAFRIGTRTKYPEGKGPGLLMRTVEENLGVQLDHWALISYDGFSRAVDELGGVDLVLPCPVNLRYQPPTSEDEEEIVLQPGLYYLDGATSLRYVRTRRGDSDFQRAGRQQQFLKAMWRQFKSPDIIPRIPALWAALKGAFATDLRLGDILALVPTALELEPQRVRSRYIGYGQVEGYTTPEGYRVQIAIPEKVAQVVASLYTPPAADDRLADEGARISVWNGTERHQLALIAADQLRWHGLKIVETGPADRSDYGRTRILVYGDHPQALDTLVRQLKVRQDWIIHDPEPTQQAGTAEADLVVILGNDYNPCH